MTVHQRVQLSGGRMESEDSRPDSRAFFRLYVSCQDLTRDMRVAADTPPPFFYLLAGLSKRIPPSPTLDRLGQWFSSFTRLLLRSRLLQPGYSLTGLSPTLSMGFRGCVSIAPCHPSYMVPTFTITGLSPVRKQYPSLGTPIFKSDPTGN